MNVVSLTGLKRWVWKPFSLGSRILRRSTLIRRVPFADHVHSWLYRLLRDQEAVQVGPYRFHLDPGSAMSKKLALYGSLEALENELSFSLLAVGDVVVDVGAHVGVFAVPASHAVGPEGRVGAFEPNPEIRQLLRRNLATNRCENVDVFDCAVADAAGEATLTEHETGSGFGSLRAFGEAGRVFRVPVVTLDEFLPDRGFLPDMLKIDVEGAEGLVLQGARRTLVRATRCIVVLELHPLIHGFGHSVPDVLAPLREADHRLFRIEGRSLRPCSFDQVARAFEEEPRRLHLLSLREPDRLPAPWIENGEEGWG